MLNLLSNMSKIWYALFKTRIIQSMQILTSPCNESKKIRMCGNLILLVHNVYLQQHWILMNINNFNNVCNIYVRTQVCLIVCVYVYLSNLYWIRFMIADKIDSIVSSPNIDVCGELNTCKSNKLFYLSLSITYCLMRIKLPLLSVCHW